MSKVPSRYLSAHGQFLQTAPFSELDLRVPSGPLLMDGEGVDVLVRTAAGLTRYTFERHPFDVVGWFGCTIPSPSTSPTSRRSPVASTGRRRAPGVRGAEHGVLQLRAAHARLRQPGHADSVVPLERRLRRVHLLRRGQLFLAARLGHRARLGQFASGGPRTGRTPAAPTRLPSAWASAPKKWPSCSTPSGRCCAWPRARPASSRPATCIRGRPAPSEPVAPSTCNSDLMSTASPDALIAPAGERELLACMYSAGRRRRSSPEPAVGCRPAGRPAVVHPASRRRKIRYGVRVRAPFVELHGALCAGNDVAAGVDAVGMSTRYINNESTLLLEDCVVDIGSVLLTLRERATGASCSSATPAAAAGGAVPEPGRASFDPVRACGAGPDLTRRACRPPMRWSC